MMSEIIIVYNLNSIYIYEKGYSNGATSNVAYTRATSLIA